MENLQRRASGVYIARLTVPERLRHWVGRRELIASTGTRQLTVAKVVAGTLLAQWRQQLLSLDRAHGFTVMHQDSVLKILDGHPLLAVGGHLPLDRAAGVMGLQIADLLRQAARGQLPLFHRFDSCRGFLVPLSALEPGDQPGTRAVPHRDQMPKEAVEHTAVGVYAIPADGWAEVASALLAGSHCTVVLFDPASAAGRLAFAPDVAVTVTVQSLEVSAADVEALRQRLATHLRPEAVERARNAASTLPHAVRQAHGKLAQKRFSEAVAAYSASPDGLPHDLASTAEQRQRKQGLLLFAEFMGDMELMKIDGDVLRQFRDGPLKSLPAKANNVPKEFRRGSLKETMAALNAAGVEWPTMTHGMQQERMRWLSRLFAWLNDKGYLVPNPAAGLAGETGMSKADRKNLRRLANVGRVAEFDDEADEGRGPFSPDELALIFGQEQYRTGNGRHVVKGNQTWYPFEFWLPLLGLFAGCRLKEACQLHLSDVRQADSVWCLDLNERTGDKSLKNEQSARLVPVHPLLVDLGLLAYCDRLRAAGYQRLFPELTYAKTDARYAKEPGRKMSAMLNKLGMPRDNYHVFHCLRHNTNNGLARVPLSALPSADEGLKKFIRYKIMGHLPGSDVNVRSYMDTPKAEMARLMAALRFDIPQPAAFDIEYGLEQVARALKKKMGDRHGKEDMGPDRGH